MNKNNNYTSKNIKQFKSRITNDAQNIRQPKHSDSIENTLEILRLLERNNNVYKGQTGIAYNL
jgi:hypothetical protein